MKLITLLSAISLLTACQGKPNHDFTIKGNIKGYTGDIQLKKMLPIEERDNLVAKTTVNKEGDFSFTIKDTSENIYSIIWQMNYSGFYGDNNPLFIINDSTLITIKIDFKSLQSDMTDILNNVNRSNKNYYAIKGSRATNDLINMAKFIDEQAKSYVKAYNYYNTDTSKNIKKDNLLKMKEMSESLRTKLLTYYDSISHPMVNFFMLCLIQKYYIFSSNEIKILAEKTLKKNPNNPYLKSIQNEMEENIKKENHIKELIEKEKNKSTTH